jgi:hypothetical protein
MLFSAHSLKLLLVLLLLLQVLCIPAEVYAASLNGSWTYRETGGDTGETTREVRQNYSFGVGPALSYKPSHALTANASVGYTQTTGVSERGSRTGRTITPTAGLSLVNDLFSARLSGNRTSSQGDSGDWSNSIDWNANLSSEWTEPFIPKLFFSYGEVGAAKGTVLDSPKSQSKNFGVGVDWDLYFAEISYRFRRAETENQPTNQSHFVKFKTAGRFWEDRIAISLSQQAQLELQEVSAGATGETIDLPVGSAVRVAISDDDAPAESSCSLISTPGIDCLESAFFPISYAAFKHVKIALAPLASRRIGAVEVSFNADFDRGSGSVWDLYEYRPSSDSWQLMATDLPVVATAEEVVGGIPQWRLRIEIPLTDQEFMLVSDSRPMEGRITNVDVFEVFPLQPGGSGRTNRSYQTNAGLQFRFSETISSSLGLTYDREELETEDVGLGDENNDRLTTSANLSWRPFTFLSASLGASEYREQKLGNEQQLNRNYSLVFSTSPLPTVNVSFGVQLNERFGDELEDQSIDIDQKTLETLRYSISGKAQIYPDLTAGFNLSYRQGQRWLKELDPDTGIFIDGTGRFVGNTGQSGRLDFNAKLYANLTADLITSYSQSEENGIASKSGSGELGLRLRLSELLLFRGSYSTYFIGQNLPDALSLRMQARLLSTEKTRLEAQLSHTQAKETVEAISLNGSWLVSKNMSLVGRGGYSFGESSNYNLTLDLSIGI